ncbi:MAG TPA: putative toxin-antitoxin system toxin component, PIN family [Thermomicrobiales bacterium]|nr:putative toxin-antitoxin system toxin component, PIN family [Thermomicrobiales bacterium]
MRVVFDTVVFVRGLINPFSVWGRLVFDCSADYLLIVSTPVLIEYLEVIQRPELTRKYRSVATRDPRAILDRLATAEVVQIADIPAVSRDPKDDPILATALAGSANFIVSEDRDLLDLDSHDGIPIVTARSFLNVIEAADRAED